MTSKNMSNQQHMQSFTRLDLINTHENSSPLITNISVVDSELTDQSRNLSGDHYAVAVHTSFAKT